MKRSPRSRDLLTAACMAMLCAGPFLQPVRADSPAWREADYARFTPQTFGAYGPAQQLIDPRAIDYELLSAAIHYATNEARTKNGGSPLVHSPALRRSAFEHSRDMATGNFFSHENPQSDAKRTPWQRMAANGITGGSRAENIAMRQTQSVTYHAFASALVQQWMKSKAHRANILNPKFKFVGCGAYARPGRLLELLATQNFSDSVPAAPSSPAPNVR